MEYSVRYIAGEPSFDTLEVIKLCCDSSIDINSRIYGQAQLGRNADLLFAKVWSFESAPASDSTVAVHLCHNQNTVTVQSTFGGDAKLLLNGREANENLTSYLISGEDLQGEYWGAVMMIPFKTLLDCFALEENDLPAAVYGNILRKNPEFSSAVPAKENAAFILMPEK